jgi:hypothetical protein
MFSLKPFFFLSRLLIHFVNVFILKNMFTGGKCFYSYSVGVSSLSHCSDLNCANDKILPVQYICDNMADHIFWTLASIGNLSPGL